MIGLKGLELATSSFETSEIRYIAKQIRNIWSVRLIIGEYYT